MSVIFGVFYIGSSKSYGEEYIENEELLTMIASVSSFFGVFRFLWSLLMLKKSYKYTYGLLIWIQIVIAFSLPTLLDAKQWLPATAYAVSICLIQMTEGGHFVLYPVILTRLYGTHAGL